MNLTQPKVFFSQPNLSTHEKPIKGVLGLGLDWIGSNSLLRWVECTLLRTQECELKRSVFIKSLELQKQYTTSYGFYSLNKTNSVSKSNQSPSSLIYYLFVSRTEQREAKIRNGNSRDPQSFRETHRSVPHFPISLPFLHFSFRKLSLSLSLAHLIHESMQLKIHIWVISELLL